MINAVRANNFLSWESLTFDIKSGVTLIDGYNRDDNTSEGSGKSAVLNAISWGLYGKIPKDANIDDVIKSNEKSCIVKVYCTDFIIVRSRNKNELYIETMDNKKVKGKDVRETQKQIEELIGMTFDTFCQTVYFAQNYPKKFITATQEDKGKILSEVQDLQLFDKARKEVMTMLKSEERALTTLRMTQQEKQLLLSGAERELELIEQQAEKDKEYRNSQILQYNNQIEYKTKELTDLDTKVKQLKEQQDKMVSLPSEEVNKLNTEIESFKQASAAIKHKLLDVDCHNNQLVELNNEKSRLQNELVRLDNNISMSQKRINTTAEKVNDLQAFIDNPESKCNTCGQDIDKPDTSTAESNKLDLLQDISDLNNNLKSFINDRCTIDTVSQGVIDKISKFKLTSTEELNNDLGNIDLEIKSRKLKVEAHNCAMDEFERSKSAIESNIGFIRRIADNIEDIKKQLNKFLNEPQVDYKQQITEQVIKVNQLREDGSNVDNLIENKNKYITQLETLKNGYREVKSYTFNSVLAELTIKSNKFLQELFEVPVTIRFKNDNMKIETEVTMNNENRGLGLLSGGQFRRTSLAVDLALSEIVALRTGSKMNIRILDEYFKDLSESSMEKCLRLLEKLGGSTILIEHNSIFKSIVDNVFECELVNGTTRSIA